MEIQSLEADFASFLVGRHVVKDGNLYVLNAVDPLFFVLHGCTTQSPNQSTSWQPYDQTLDRLVPDKIVRDCVAQSQMGHLFETLCTEQTDNVTYYKFAEAKALEWLKRKQDRVYQCLLSQEKERKQRRQALLARRPQGPSSNTGGKARGSASATFYIPEDPMAAPVVHNKDEEETSMSTMQKLKMESLQIVCNYLSEEWTDKFLNYMGVTFDQVFAQVQAKSGSLSTIVIPGTESTVMTTPAKVTPKPVRVEPARSIANKRLEKVNKRGMSALTSFFGPPKKKLANTKD